MSTKLKTMSTPPPSNCDVVPGTEPPQPDPQLTRVIYEPSSYGVLQGVPVVGAKFRRRAFCRGVGMPVLKRAYADSLPSERYTDVLQL